MKSAHFLFNVMLLCLLFAAQGCRKTPELVVEGMVNEFYQGESLEGARVSLAYSPLAFGSVSSGYENIASTLTDVDGYYRISFEEPATANYRLLVRKEGFVQSERVVVATDWSADQENFEDFLVYADVQLELRFEATSFGGSALFQLGKHSVGCSNCCLDQQSYFINTDTTLICKVYGNQAIDYSITRLRPGIAEEEVGVLQIGAEIFQQSWSF